MLQEITLAIGVLFHYGLYLFLIGIVVIMVLSGILESIEDHKNKKKTLD